jgi:hypothetical protein
VPAGIRQVYDRQQFRKEKWDALARWAWALANVLKPDGNVMVLPRRWAGTGV